MECLLNNGNDSAISSQCSEGIKLQPLLHQVAGRATIMCLNETTVCKPLNFREKYFYQSLPPDIEKFTAKFKGVVNVKIEERKDGTIALTALPTAPEDNQNETETFVDLKPDSHCFSQKRIKLSRSGSLYVDNDQESTSFTEDENANMPALQVTAVNPWTVKVYKEGLRRQLKSKHKVVQKCILLENVTGRFKLPCILDLKMGTRVHGDFDDEEKRKRQLQKCANTTTQTLGMRLGGMQVYRSASGDFLCRNKYYGRTLDGSSLKDTIRLFFHNGKHLRKELLTPIIARITKLERSLCNLTSYRFYASSLLIMYDGAIDFDEKGKENPKSYLDVRMIDFAKSTHKNMDEAIVHTGPDNGYLFGLQSLVKILSEMLQEEHC